VVGERKQQDQFQDYLVALKEAGATPVPIASVFAAAAHAGADGPIAVTDKRGGLRAWLVTEGNRAAVAEWVSGEVRPNQFGEAGVWFDVGGDELCCCEE
jgi:hypothetical protein